MKCGFYFYFWSIANFKENQEKSIDSLSKSYSRLVWPEYYSISAADVFVLVHSNFDHYKQTDKQTDRQTNRVFFSRPVVEVSLRDDLIIRNNCAPHSPVHGCRPRILICSNREISLSPFHAAVLWDRILYFKTISRDAQPWHLFCPFLAPLCYCRAEIWQRRRNNCFLLLSTLLNKNSYGKVFILYQVYSYCSCLHRSSLEIRLYV